jgi:nitroimidazol reductase NimA-like FMN-containing flavoprotein (pyridoxamine 5'-phosphate oxidase superfamily)
MSELTMSKADREAFLADVHVGIVGIARHGAPPLTAPTWYSYEPGGDVVFSFAADSEKVRLLRSVGEASLCAQTEAMPYQYVTVEGPVVIGEHDDAVQASLAYRYMGQEVGDLYLATIEGSVSVVVRLTPTRWRTVDYAKFGG